MVFYSAISVSLQNVWQARLSILGGGSNQWANAQRIAQGQAMLMFGLASLLVSTTASYWVPIAFAGFSADQHHLVELLSIPLLGWMFFAGLTAMLTTAQRSRDQFIGAEVASLAGTLLAIGGAIALVPRAGVVAAAWISLCRAVFVFGIVFWMAGRPIPSPVRAWNERDTWRQLRMLLAGSSLYKTSPLIDRYWSSHAPAGGVTVFNLAQLAMSSLGTILERSISVPIAPQLARLVESNDMPGLRALYRRGVLRITLLAGVILLALFAVWPVWRMVVAVLLKFQGNVADELWLVCVLLLGYLHVAASGTIVTSAFMALGDTRTPVLVGVIGFFFGVALKSVAFVVWGIAGLALATSAYYLVNLVAMLLLLERSIHVRST